MSTFDGWETQLYGDVLALPGQLSDNELMHFRTKGSKNGVRRYQQPDGTWTPLGLRERREREGWGESRRERRAEKQVARAERRAAKAEKRAARIEKKANKTAAKKQAIAAAKEKKRLNGDISNLTDEELKQKIARVKMEMEYKELTRSPVLKTGEKVVSKLIEMRAAKAEQEEARAQRALDRSRIQLDLERTKSERIKAREGTKKAKEEAYKAKQERKKMKEDRKAGLATERAADLKRAKIEWKGTTLHGGIIRALNTRMNAGLKEKLTKIRTEEGAAAAKLIKTRGDHGAKNLNKKLTDDENRAAENERRKAENKRLKGVAAYEKEQTRLRQERIRTQEEYSARAKKMQEEARKLERQQQAREERQRRQKEAEQKRRREAAERERKKSERQANRKNKS